MWSPGGGAFPVSVILRVTVDGDDADGGTGRVRDDDWLRLVTSKRAVEHRGGMNRSHGPGEASKWTGSTGTAGKWTVYTETEQVNALVILGQETLK